MLCESEMGQATVAMDVLWAVAVHAGMAHRLW